MGPFERVDALVRASLESGCCSGCALIVLQRGEVRISAAYGVPDPEKPDVRTSATTLFDLASITKVAVAMLFMTLVERGVAGLDEPVCNVVPECKAGQRRYMTYRHLLAHTSGYPPTVDIYSEGQWLLGSERLGQFLAEQELLSKPGERVAYSCVGYAVLGVAMQRLAECDLEQMLANFVEPVVGGGRLMYRPWANGYRNVAVTARERPQRGPLAAGVVHDGLAIALNDGVAGNAGLFGSAEGLARLAETFRTGRLLLAETSMEMVRNQTPRGEPRRGLGWKLWSTQRENPGRVLSRESYGHMGFTGTMLWVDPLRELTVIHVSNSVLSAVGSRHKDRYWRLAERLLKTVCDEVDCP